MKLVIGNKCYSSWSLRAWLLLRAKGIAFEEVLVLLDTPEFRKHLQAAAPQGGNSVPCLIDGEVTAWETLAIAEYLHERYPERGVWPADLAARAHARAASSEIHAGFPALFKACPMNLGKRFAARDRGEAAGAAISRITAIWREARRRFGEKADGPYLYGDFSAADAMFAPVATRFETYSVTVDPVSAAYVKTILAHPAYRQWLEAALREPWILPIEEIDEPAIANLRQP